MLISGLNSFFGFKPNGRFNGIELCPPRNPRGGGGGTGPPNGIGIPGSGGGGGGGGDSGEEKDAEWDGGWTGLLRLEVSKLE